MRVVNKQEFYKLPSGTLCSNYEPCIINGLFIKLDTIYCEDEPSDFCYQDLIESIECRNSDEHYQILTSSQESNSEFKMDYDSSARDGLYEDKQLFIVYDKSDVQELIYTLITIL